MWLIFIFIIYINYQLNKLYKQKYMERNNANINNVNTNLSDYTLDELLDSFQASGLSDYYTWYMRLLTSLNMKKNQEVKN